MRHIVRVGCDQVVFAVCDTAEEAQRLAQEASDVGWAFVEVEVVVVEEEEESSGSTRRHRMDGSPMREGE